MFRLDGRQPQGNAKGDLNHREEVSIEDLQVVQAGAPLTSSLDGILAPPQIWFERGGDVRDYLAFVEKTSRRALKRQYRWRGVPEALQPHLAVTSRFDQLAPILASVMNHPSVEIERVGVLDVRQIDGPPFIFSAPGKPSMDLRVGASCRLDALIDFGETTSAPFSTASRLRLIRRYPLRLSLQSDGPMLSLGCLLVDDSASTSFQTESQSSHESDGTFPPLLKRAQFSYEDFEARLGTNFVPLIRAALGDPSLPPGDQGFHVMDFLRISISQPTRSVALFLELRMPASILRGEDLSRYLVAVRQFHEWMLQAENEV